MNNTSSIAGAKSARAVVLQKTAKRILVVGPSWVGDAVMMQPLLMRLKQYHPDCSIDVLAPDWVRPLLARMPQVSATLANPFGHGELKLGARWRLARVLARNDYDQAIILPNSLKSALIPWLAGIPVRTGFVGELRYGLLNDARKLDESAYPLMVERFALLAEAPNMALPRPLPAPALTVKETQRQSVLQKLGLDTTSPVAALCPGAEYGPAKRWPAEHFARLAILLYQRGYAVWIVGSDKDRDIGDAIVAASGAYCRNLCGQTSLDEAVDLLASASVVITNDSGLMHVAAALDKPMAAIYGSSSPGFTPPLTPKARIVSLNLSCSPCFKRECPLGHLNCLRELAPERVLTAIETKH